MMMSSTTYGKAAKDDKGNCVYKTMP